jgi:hypothetical protein
MKQLIAEDDLFLAEITSELRRSLGRRAQLFEAITLAQDLEGATLSLPEHDVVLGDGIFPLTRNSRHVVEGWDVVCQEANRGGIPFVLYSGSVRALDCARERNAPALGKPPVIEEIYAALTYQRVSTLSKTHGQPALRTETCNFAGDNHVTDL